MRTLTADLARAPVEIAPDGSRVRPLVRFDAASMAHFQLSPDEMSSAVRHRHVRELWFVIAGGGAIWREGLGETALEPGTALAIEAGVGFQFRAGGDGLEIVATTVPAWPGDDEAVPVDEHWAE